MENEEKAFQKGAGFSEDEADTFLDQVSVTLIHGFEELKWEGQADTPISQIQDENWFATEEKTAWSQEGESYPCDTPIGVVVRDDRTGLIWLGAKPVVLMGETPVWGCDEWGGEEEPVHLNVIHPTTGATQANSTVEESLEPNPTLRPQQIREEEINQTFHIDDFRPATKEEPPTSNTPGIPSEPEFMGNDQKEEREEIYPTVERTNEDRRPFQPQTDTGKNVNQSPHLHVEQPVQRTNPIVGEHIKSTDDRPEESLADGSMDVSGNDYPGSQKTGSNGGEIGKGEQVVLGGSNSDRPAGIQDTLDTGELANPVESKADGYETSSKPNSTLEMKGVRVEKLVKGIKLEIKKKSATSLHSQDDTRRTPRRGIEESDQGVEIEGTSKRDEERSTERPIQEAASNDDTNYEGRVLTQGGDQDRTVEDGDEQTNGRVDQLPRNDRLPTRDALERPSQEPLARPGNMIPLDHLKPPTESTLEARVSWNGWTIQTFFKPSSLEKDIRKRIKEAWGLKKKNVYLIVNGHGTGYTPQKWPVLSSIRVVIKGPGGAEVVIQGPGGWEVELDAETAREWMWHCGLCQAEIEGWTYHTKLLGGERITLLKTPKRWFEKKETNREEEQHKPSLHQAPPPKKKHHSQCQKDRPISQ
jgi:hypothetical protein